MTLPFERKITIKNVRHFLRSLLDPKLTPRVPLLIRKHAKSLLKHYPTDLDMEDVKRAFDKAD